MKTLTSILTVIVALSLLITVVAPAQNASSGESRRDSDISSREDGISVVLAQAPTDPPTTPSPAPPAPSPVQTPGTPTPPTLPSSTPVGLVSNDLFADLSFGVGSGMVLVIPSEKTSTEDLIKINEDMNVMSRIFEKNLEQERVTTVTNSIFIPGRRNAYGTFLGSSRDQIQSMYLQGFGALFLLKVDFPLSPPPDVQEEQQETQKTEQGDPLWQQIKEEMYEPEKVDRGRRTDRPEIKYDAEKVENLKTTLIKTLKHAKNIRCLKPDESVILTVVGSGESTGTTIEAARVLPGTNQIVVVEKNAYGTKTQKVVQGKSLDALEDIGLSSPAVLVIRTKKSDINEFAKGDLDFEKFSQRVQLLTYPLLGGADGHGDHFNPFIQLRSSGSSNMRR